MAIVETLFTLVALGYDEGIAPSLAFIIADFAHNVDALVAADVRVAVVPVVGNDEQSAVVHLHDCGDAVVLVDWYFGVK